MADRKAVEEINTASVTADVRDIVEPIGLWL